MSINTISATHGAVDQGAHTEAVVFNGQGTASGTPSEWTRYYYREGFDYVLGTAGPYTDTAPTRSSDGSFGFVGSPISGPGWTESYSFDFSVGYGGFNAVTDLSADRQYALRARGNLIDSFDESFVLTHNGGNLSFKTNAVTLTFSGSPSAGSIGITSAQLSQSFFPNTNESTATARFQYRVLGSPTWSEAASSNYSGYSIQTRTTTVSGLAGGTTYEYRLRVTRTTNNGTDNFGSTATFTTLPEAPTVTNSAASGIGHNAATLNGVIDPNTIASRIRFGWGDNDAGATAGSWDNLTAYQNFSGDGDQGVSQAITGLTPSTTYFFRIFVEYPDPTFGSSTSATPSLSFATTADPGVAATNAGQQLPTETIYNAKYGVARDFYFTVDVPGVVSNTSNRFFNAAAPWVAGDVKVSKDGGALANVSTLPTRIGSTPLYKWSAGAAELQAADIVVLLVDADGPVWRDHMLRIQTKLLQGQIDVDSTMIGGSADALKLTGVGTGYGIDAVGGSTSDGDVVGALWNHSFHTGLFSSGGATPKLATSADATDDFYNGCIVMIVDGPGEGQSRVISDYSGTSKQLSLNRAWTVNPTTASRYVIVPSSDDWALMPSAELSSLPADLGTFSDKIQFLFQRWAFRRVEDSEATRHQFLYKADSTTVLASGVYSDSGGSGGTHDHEKMA